jgi:hypothetical protein
MIFPDFPEAIRVIYYHQILKYLSQSFAKRIILILKIKGLAHWPTLHAVSLPF